MGGQEVLRNGKVTVKFLFEQLLLDLTHIDNALDGTGDFLFHHGIQQLVPAILIFQIIDETKRTGKTSGVALSAGDESCHLFAIDSDAAREKIEGLFFQTRERLVNGFAGK